MMDLSRTAQIRQQQTLDHYKGLAEARGKALAQLKAKLAQDARPRKAPRTFRPVRPSLGIEAAYRKAIDKLIAEMNASVLYWLSASFKANEPEIVSLALDALPANELRWSIRQLSRRWHRNFNKAAPKLARWFSQRVSERSSSTLQKILKDGGWTVDIKLSSAQQDILHATIQQNVSLIRSIPSQYFTQIEGMVMRSVQTGRDLHQLTNDLQRQFRVTRKRAALIARDQNNKANAALTRVHQLDLGITKALWIHSHAGKEPRPTHLANHGKEYDVRKGWYDPAERQFVHPGSLINCRCTSRSIIPGLD